LLAQEIGIQRVVRIAGARINELALRQIKLVLGRARLEIDPAGLTGLDDLLENDDRIQHR
jgi:hypothetical protein